MHRTKDLVVINRRGSSPLPSTILFHTASCWFPALAVFAFLKQQDTKIIFITTASPWMESQFSEHTLRRAGGNVLNGRNAPYGHLRMLLLHPSFHSSAKSTHSQDISSFFKRTPPLFKYSGPVTLALYAQNYWMVLSFMIGDPPLQSLPS